MRDNINFKLEFNQVEFRAFFSKTAFQSNYKAIHLSNNILRAEFISFKGHYHNVKYKKPLSG